MKKCRFCGESDLEELVKGNGTYGRLNQCKKCKREQTNAIFQDLSEDEKEAERLKRKIRKHCTLEGKALDLLTSAKSRCKKRKNRNVTITKQDIIDQYHIQKGCCAISGLPFVFALPDETRCNPLGMSLDRKDNAGDYSIDNIQLLTCQVNLAKGDGTDSDLIKLAHAISEFNKENKK